MSRLETSDGSQKDFYETSRELKANERMQILKALTSPKNKVIDLASLRKYLQNVSNILKQVGLLGAADICIRDEDPLDIIQRYETMWENNPKQEAATKSQDQEGIILFEALKEKFAFNSILRKKLELIEQNEKIPNKLKGIATL